MSKTTEISIPVSHALRKLLIEDLEEDLELIDEARADISTTLDLLRRTTLEPECPEPTHAPPPALEVPTKSSHMSAAARRRISRAQKARWQKQRDQQAAGPYPKKHKKRAADRGNGGTSADVKKKRHVSFATRKKMALAQKARWVRFREAGVEKTKE
jgi:hypothetical protein